MPDEMQLEEILRKEGLLVSGCVVKDGLVDGVAYAFIEVKRDRNNLQTPSNKALAKIKHDLMDRGVNVDFILRDGARQDIEAGARATVRYSFDKVIRNLFLSEDGTLARVWIVPKSRVSDDVMGRVENTLKIFLEGVGLRLESVNLTGDENIPTKTACMRTIREYSPTESSRISAVLREKGFTVPSDDWMSRRLDSLRKGGLVVRLKNGRYALSSAGLKGLGTTKNKSSPDVARMLDLARYGR